MQRLRLAIPLLPVAMPLISFRPVPFVDAPAIAATTKMRAATFRTAISAARMQRGRIIAAATRGAVDAMPIRCEHSMHIGSRHDTAQRQITHVDSPQLECAASDAPRRVHGNHPGWSVRFGNDSQHALTVFGG